MAKTISEHAVSAAGATVKSAGYAVRGAHTAIGLSAPPSWAGYWTFVTGSIIILFALYLAQHGRLTTWLQFFSWSNPATNTTATGAAATGAAGRNRRRRGGE